MVVINNTVVALASKRTVTILSGDSLQHKEEERNYDSEKIIMSAKGVGMLDNNGSKFRFSRFAQQNYTYAVRGLISDLLVTDAYAISARII